MTVTCVAASHDRLGESCFHDPRDSRVWWTDIEGRRVHRLDSESGRHTTFALPDRAGFILPRREAGFLLGFPDRIVVADPGFTRFTVLHEVETDVPQTRINDAAVDPFGGIVFGTHDESPVPEDRRPVGGVYRLGPDGTLTRLFGAVTTANGIAFAADGRLMYVADTPVGVIRRFEVEPDFASFRETGPLAGADVAPGRPDGAKVDAEGHYWSARVWGDGLVRIAPDGQVTQRVQLPVHTPTCVAFGGPGLKRLYVTSLTVGQTEAARATTRAATRAATPDAGNLLALDVAVPGLPQPLAAL